MEHEQRQRLHFRRRQRQLGLFEHRRQLVVFRRRRHTQRLGRRIGKRDLYAGLQRPGQRFGGQWVQTGSARRGDASGTANYSYAYSGGACSGGGGSGSYNDPLDITLSGGNWSIAGEGTLAVEHHNGDAHLRGVCGDQQRGEHARGRVRFRRAGEPL